METRICSRCGKVFYTMTPEWGYKRGKKIFCGFPCSDEDFKEEEEEEAKRKKQSIRKSKKCSEKKMKQIEMARSRASESRTVRVRQYTTCGEFVAEYDSIKEAASAVGISTSMVCSCATGKSRTAGGFVWKRSDNNDFKQIISQGEMENN